MAEDDCEREFGKEDIWNEGEILVREKIVSVVETVLVS